MSCVKLHVKVYSSDTGNPATVLAAKKASLSFELPVDWLRYCINQI
jgi:hypothetical protein